MTGHARQPAPVAAHRLAQAAHRLRTANLRHARTEELLRWHCGLLLAEDGSVRVVERCLGEEAEDGRARVEDHQPLLRGRANRDIDEELGLQKDIIFVYAIPT